MNDFRALTRRLFSEETAIWWLLAVAAAIRMAALLYKGVYYQDFVDAQRYMDSARTLAATGALSFAGTLHSAYQMPGYAAFLSLFYLAPGGSSTSAYVMAKIALLVIAVASIYVLYLLGRRIGGTRVGLLSALLLTLSIPHIYTGTLTLSENPYMLALLLTALMLIRLADEPTWGRLAWFIAALCSALFIKQAIIGMLPAAAAYLAARRMPLKDLAKYAAVTAIALVVVLTPWWLRNYRVFGEFVPFQSFEGAPFYEGTYQRFQPYGTGSFDGMGKVIDGSKGTELEKSKLLIAAGWSRIRDRWSQDPRGLLFSYFLAKPAAAWSLPFYWDQVFGISGYWVLRLHALGMALGLVLLVVYSVRSRARAEFLMLLVNVLIITAGTIYYLGLSRYVYPYVPFVFIALAYLGDSMLSRVAPGLTPATA